MQAPGILSGKQPRITVFLDDSSPKVLKPLKCMVCGKTFLEYYTTVDMIVPGEPPDAKTPIVVQCNGVMNVLKDGQYLNTRCKTKYYVC